MKELEKLLDSVVKKYGLKPKPGHIGKHLEVNLWLGLSGGDVEKGVTGCELCQSEAAEIAKQLAKVSDERKAELKALLNQFDNEARAETIEETDKRITKYFGVTYPEISYINDEITRRIQKNLTDPQRGTYIYDDVERCRFIVLMIVGAWLSDRKKQKEAA